MGKISFFILSCITIVFAESFYADMHESLDLEPLLGIPWKLVSAPSGTEGVSDFHFLTPDSGIATLMQNGHPCLYWYKNGNWRLLYESGAEAIAGPFLFNMQQFCAIYSDGSKYKGEPIFYSHGNWQVTHAPNPDRIHSFYFDSPSKGWAACESSRLLFWDGLMWQDLYTNVAAHYLAVLPYHDRIYTSIKHSAEFLMHSRANNQLLQHTSTDSFYTFLTSLAQILDASRNFNPIPQHIITRTDTIFLHTDSRDLPFFWLCKQSGTKSFGYLGDMRLDYEELDVTTIAGISSKLYTHFPSGHKYYLAFNLDQTCREIYIIRQAPPLPEKLLTNVQKNTDETAFAFADINNDGIEDYYIIVSAEANKLLASIKDSPTYANAFMEVAEKAGVQGGAFVQQGVVNYDSDALVADLDEDGDQDIFVASLYGPNEFFRQYRKMHFKEDAKITGVLADSGRSLSVLSGDINNDGKLDLLVCNSGEERNHFYLNNGAGVFTDYSQQLATRDLNGIGWQLADFDNDNDLDLFAPQFRLPDRLFLNEIIDGRPHFMELENWRANVDSLFFTKATAIGDFDNDGDLDLYCCRSGYPDALYANDGNAHFTDVTAGSGLENDLITHCANAFDVDNDGLLDLYVATRQKAKIYKNLGNFHFRDLQLDYIYYPKSYPGIAIAADMDNDGDVDLRIEDGFNRSLECKNQSNNNRFIKIKVKGCKSNRDAIGTQLVFYDADHLGDADYCRGLRVVNGGDTMYGKNSRVIHLGLGDAKPRDVHIRFPSGTEKNLYNIQPGSTLTVYELDGLARKFYLARKQIIAIVQYPPFQLDAAVFFLYVIILYAAVKFVAVRFSWRHRVRQLLLFLPTAVYIVLFILLFYTSILLRYFIPSVIGFSTCALFCYISIKNYYRDMDQPELFEKIFFKTAAFFHGEWGATRLNRLQFFCSNADAETLADQDFRNALNEVINSYYSLLTPEVEMILSLIKRAIGFAENYQVLKWQHHFLLGQLNKLRIAINLQQNVENEFTTTYKAITTFKNELTKIRTTVSKDFIVDVGNAIQKFFDIHQFPHIQIAYTPPAEDFFARIRSAEFSQIFENLVQNADRAMQTSKKCILTVTCTANLDHVNVFVADSGPGITPAVKNQLFEHQVSTRPQGGGFGLFYAAQLLKKYGGSIQLVDSDYGACFLIQLRRIQHE